MSQYTPQQPPAIPGPYGGGPMLKPHRGTLILVLGILGILMCQICGIVAWIMANGDLREMNAGRMDPAGRETTNAGKVCGIISVVLMCIGLVIAVLWILLFVVILGAGAAAASRGHP